MTLGYRPAGWADMRWITEGFCHWTTMMNVCGALVS